MMQLRLLIVIVLMGVGCVKGQLGQGIKLDPSKQYCPCANFVCAEGSTCETLGCYDGSVCQSGTYYDNYASPISTTVCQDGTLCKPFGRSGSASAYGDYCMQSQTHSVGNTCIKSDHCASVAGTTCYVPLTSSDCSTQSPAGPICATPNSGLVGDDCDPACADGLTCNNGTCGCGLTGATCASDFQCVSDVCQCNADGHCAGNSNQCSNSGVCACGTTGGVCNKPGAPTCNGTGASATCGCGNGTACTAGLTCKNGTCGCGSGQAATTCAAGYACNSTGSCACGTSEHCTGVSNQCNSGTCGCGTGSACATGLTCNTVSGVSKCVASRIVFTTNRYFSVYDLEGSAANADRLCNEYAQSTRGEFTGMTFAALISTTTNSAWARISSRFNDLDRPVMNSNASRVWNKTSDLKTTAPMIDPNSVPSAVSSVSVDELGVAIVAAPWTGSHDPVTVGTKETTCNNWQSSTAADTAVIGGGSGNAPSNWWGDLGSYTWRCNGSPLTLICIQVD